MVGRAGKLSSWIRIGIRLHVGDCACDGNLHCFLADRGRGCVTVSANGEVGRPLRRDNMMIGNETTSLCSVDAWRFFRAAVFGTPTAMILVSTDGCSNSFQDDEGFFRFGSDVLGLVIADGIETVNDSLDGWLREMTVTGSGDDISLGIACRPNALPAAASRPPEQES